MRNCHLVRQCTHMMVFWGVTATRIISITTYLKNGIVFSSSFITDADSATYICSKEGEGRFGVGFVVIVDAGKR